MTGDMTRRAAIAALGFGGIGGMTRSTSSAADVKSEMSYHGTWTYRSFFSKPEIETDFRDLEFARATITIEDAPFGVLRGLIRWGEKGDEGLALKGSITYGNPFTARFQGRGDTAGTKDWIYDYLGFVIPMWPDGSNQRPAIVGTVIRTVAHGKNSAGFVASFIAVKRDK
jgi:hypothetical protein